MSISRGEAATRKAITFDASWTANTYTLRLHHNDGSNNYTDMAMTYDLAANLQTVTRTGYTFANWSTNPDGGGTTYTEGQSVSNLTDVNGAIVDLYAQWTVNTYTVTLDNQSATNPGTASVTATYDAAMPAITVPTKTGYTFGGYYTETNGGGTQYYNAEGTSAHNWDIASANTLYAQWTANTYTVTLDNQSATTPGTASVTATFYAAMPAITVPTRMGYTFGGYYTATNGGGTKYYNADGSSAHNWDIASASTLYAQWTANTYTVTLDNQSATTPGTASVTATYDDAMPAITVPTKTDYTFGGYYSETNGGGTKYYNADGTSAHNWNIASATTLYALWIESYTVTLDNQNATTPGTASVTAVYGAAMPPITVPTKTGYTFGGYYTETNGGGTKYYNADGSSAHNWDIASATTLYALWIESYTVTLDNQNATTPGTASVTAVYGAAMPPITVPTKTGYTFCGYYTETDGGGTQYYNGDGSSAHNWDITSATTLYAQWNVTPWTGSGTTENDPFLIRYASQLVKLADSVNSGTKNYSGKYFKLGNNIDMSGVAFDGIGYNSTHSFQGTFNGDGKTISNVIVNKSGQSYVGFFGYVRYGTVKNLILDGVSITGRQYIGALVGYGDHCSIENCLVMNSSVTYNINYTGIICGNPVETTLTGNHYRNCILTQNNQTYTTNIGVGDFSSSNDIAGARSVHTLAVPEHVIVSGGETVTYNQVTYYAAGVDVTLTPETGFVLTDVSVTGTTVTDNNDGTWSFTMPAADAIVTATVTVEGVPYIDENGHTQYCTDYTVLDGTMRDLEGTYVVTGNVEYWEGVFLWGDVTLILADGCTMSIGENRLPIIGIGINGYGSKLTIYGQSNQTGTLNVYTRTESTNYDSSIYDVEYAQHGGIVNLDDQTDFALYGYYSTITGGTLNAHGDNYGELTISGGTVNITGSTYNGDVTFSGGNLTISGYLGCNANLGWSNLTDRITVNSYYPDVFTVTIAEGQSFWNGSEVLSGTISDPDKLNGKTLVPYYSVGGNYVRITSLDQLTDGSKVIIAARYDDNYTNGYYAMPGQTYDKPTGVAFSSETSVYDEILPATITDYEDTYSWTVNVTNDGYTFMNADGQMIGYTSGTNFNTDYNTAWTIARETAAETAMVTGYTGFVIRNGNNNSRAFAFDGTAFGAYYTNNTSTPGYNFYLDFFVQQEAVETLAITGYGEGNGGWKLIASPFLEVTPTAGNGFLTEEYDLYWFDQTEDLEWRNYKATPFNLESGKGYLYASQANTTLIFTGIPYSGNGEVTLSKTTGVDFEGWNLVGNPFNQTAYVDRSFYVMNPAGTQIIPATGNSVAAMEGIFVIAAEDGETMTFSTEDLASSDKSMLVLNISHPSTGSGDVIDRAIVRFGEERLLPKFQIMGNSTKIYIPQDGKEYAIACAKGYGEIPVNFEAKKNGTYTLSFNCQEVSFSYLHLIDNMTGNDIDLLDVARNVSTAPTYTFNAKTTDYASRFKLVFVCGDANGDNGNFAFIDASGNIVITDVADACDASIQVIDMTGRVVRSSDVARNVSTTGMVAGVYVLRLINGDDIKVQNIVID